MSVDDWLAIYLAHHHAFQPGHVALLSGYLEVSVDDPRCWLVSRHVNFSLSL